MDAYSFIAEAELSRGNAREALKALDNALARKPDAVPQLERASWILVNVV